MKAILKVLLVVGSVLLLVLAGWYLFASTQIAEAPAVEDATGESESDMQGDTDTFDSVEGGGLETGAVEGFESTGITCPASYKGQQVCTKEYMPVCALVEVQCVTTPCNPIPETFSNVCMACINDNVATYTEGACSLEVS